MASEPSSSDQPKGLRLLASDLTKGLSIGLGILALLGLVWVSIVVWEEEARYGLWRRELLPFAVVALVSVLVGVGAMLLARLSRLRLVHFIAWSCIGAVLIALVILFSWISFSWHRRGPMSPDAVAIGSLRTLNSAEISYAATYPHGFSPSLSSLGPPAHGKNPSEEGAWLIGSDLASGQRSGYRFVYSAGPRDEKGRITAYTIWANPSQASMAYFYTDQTGVIRRNDSRPASATDPPISD